MKKKLTFEEMAERRLIVQKLLFDYWTEPDSYTRRDLQRMNKKIRRLLRRK